LSVLVEAWLHPVLRAIHYALLLGLFGLTAFPLTGLRGVDRPRHWPGIAVMAMLAPLISAILMLLSIAAMMGQPVLALEGAVVEAMLTDTSIGWAFGIRMALLSVGAALVKRWPSAAAMLYAAALATLPWSGHAAAGEGTIGLAHRLNDAVHVLAAGLWIGAIGWFAVLTVKASRGALTPAPLLASMHRFAPIGIALVMTVAVTGMLNTQFIVGWDGWPVVLTTAYGQLLLVKIAMVGLMLFCATRHAAKVRAAQAQGNIRADGQAMISAIRTTLGIEFALGIGVVGVVAVLGMLSPMS
jgi:copper resistance protein D